MSIHRIPDRYLNTTLHIFRETTAIDSIGDLSTSQSLAYASLKANIQPKLDDTEFEIHGKVHRQDHVARINRVEDSILREIKMGDIALDQNTNIRYMVLGVENWQSANVRITDSHHIKIILKSLSGVPKEQLNVNTVTSKGRIS
jgi:hypothetical protein